MRTHRTLLALPVRSFPHSLLVLSMKSRPSKLHFWPLILPSHPWPTCLLPLTQILLLILLPPYLLSIHLHLLTWNPLNFTLTPPALLTPLVICLLAELLVTSPQNLFNPLLGIEAMVMQMWLWLMTWIFQYTYLTGMIGYLHAVATDQAWQDLVMHFVAFEKTGWPTNGVSAV